MERVLYIAKWIAGVIGGVTAVAGIVSFIYTLGVKQEQKNAEKNNVVVNIDRLVKADSVQLVLIKQIASKQNDMIGVQVITNSRLDNLYSNYKNLYTNYKQELEKEKKYERLIQLIENEKKNEGTSMLKIPYTQNNSVTPSN